MPKRGDKMSGIEKHKINTWGGVTSAEPFTGDIEKHGITKYKQTPEPYFGPYEIIGGGNQWGWPDEWPAFWPSGGGN